MNSKGKGIITAVIVVLIALAAFCGFGYISQRMTASEGITFLIRKNIRKHTNNLTMQQGNSLSFSQSKRKMFYSTKERLFIRWESMGKP